MYVYESMYVCMDVHKYALNMSRKITQYHVTNNAIIIILSI